jgi:hypothetical protein
MRIRTLVICQNTQFDTTQNFQTNFIFKCREGNGRYRRTQSEKNVIRSDLVQMFLKLQK